ncbi:hypothetical protein BVG16_12860 [Paenibacillus selenitireducens]|uniref:Uncharacterized protein n=1 Tax=Paenibacillus selenitireducens TaxID=1324314 RepID=A0A1T2XFR6_9BACL|nr:hypothetical protein [Paenibacillus selenitireducens]OPA78731.1 hypothetical protein BVG16_12860 [Paenibacillus selenitireducens]
MDHEIEYDRDTFRNIRRNLGLILELINDHTDVLPTRDPARSKHEVRGGYKIASRRGARLDEVEVFNFYFKFRSHLRGDGIALMYRTNHNQERIILLPDNTERRYSDERRSYLGVARGLLFRGWMDSDEQSELIENLQLLNVHERCAQSLQHEYGHILHWREFDHLGIHSPLDIYDWFVEHGYYELVEMRMPGFENKSALDKVWILKEAFVEDYRISLDLSDTNGKFILPNKFCHFGDFQMPELLSEGVKIMKKMIANQIGSSPSQRPTSSSEMDSLEVIRRVSDEGFKTKWRAGQKRSNQTTMDKDRAALRQMSEAAISLDM